MQTYIALCPTCNLVVAGRVDNERHIDTAQFLSDCARRGLTIQSTKSMRDMAWCKCERPERKEVPGVKLWRAIVEIEVFVASEKLPSDWLFADAARDEIGDNRDAASVYAEQEVCSLDEIPEEWRGTLPRGHETDGDLTCEQIVEACEAWRLEAIRNAPMPNQMELPIQ